jgi:hypothetical protein
LKNQEVFEVGLIGTEAKVGLTVRQAVKANWSLAVDKKPVEEQREPILHAVLPFQPVIKSARREKRVAKEFLGRNKHEGLA